ncbi:MAG: hypothetical protein ABR536_02660 [Solirubrobacterales bacterium]
MRANERNILFILGGVLLLAAFWFLVLSPKRSEVSDLRGKISELKGSVDQERQRALFADAAKDQFASNYRKVVVLGKAAPESSDTASFLVQLNDLADRSKVDFRGIELDATAAAAAPAPSQPGLDNAPPSTSQPSASAPAPQPGQPATATDSTQPTPAPATEASASTLAIGATVGPAGLGTLKYKLTFRGTFFDVAGFMAAVDRLVRSSNGRVSVNGRLTTVDGFALSADQAKGFPTLTASLAVTTYLTPADQGTTAGATPQGPSPSLPGQSPQLAASQGATP